jgi:hypothetical protein
VVKAIEMPGLWRKYGKLRKIVKLQYLKNRKLKNSKIPKIKVGFGLTGMDLFEIISSDIVEEAEIMKRGRRRRRTRRMRFVVPRPAATLSYLVKTTDLQVDYAVSKNCLNVFCSNPHLHHRHRMSRRLSTLLSFININHKVWKGKEEVKRERNKMLK